MDTIIGLEIHLQLKTNSKMFCSCNSQYFEKEPNIYTCPVCMGFPGALPVPNKKSLELCILLGIACNCDISNEIKFDRKHYFYPDLPKGYQISQYDEPLCSDGYLSVTLEGNVKRDIEIERIHQEEDVAKSFHLTDPVSGKEYSLIDYNKSGVPLVEIVTKPVIRSSVEAKLFATKVRQIARYLGISDADMEKGQMRCEPNISLQEKGKWEYKDGKILAIGDYKLNPKVEVKNIGSISAVEKSIEYEIKRISEEISQGKEQIQQTRGWNAEKGITEFQRSKESAEDYRYFKEPDIPIIKVSTDVLERISEQLVELPNEKEERYRTDYNLSDYDISVLTSSRDLADFFEMLVEAINIKINNNVKSAKLASNWFTTILFSIMNKENVLLIKIKKEIDTIVEIIIDVERKKVVGSVAKEFVYNCLRDNKNLKEEYAKSNLTVQSDNSFVDDIVQKVISTNEKAIEDYKAGKENALGFLVGQAMRLSKGKVDPNTVKEYLINKINK